MAKTKKSNKAEPCCVSAPRKSVDIQKAQNGFVVRQWTEKGEKVLVAKTAEEANAMAAKLLK